jgi:hypothetical protein
MATRTTRFSAEIDSAFSSASVIMSGDVDAYAVEQLLETAQRNARPVSSPLDGDPGDPAHSILQHRLARLARRGIEVTFAHVEAQR